MPIQASENSRRHFLRWSGAGGLALSGIARAQAGQKATLAYGSTGYTWATTFLAEALGSWKTHGVELSAVDFPTGRDSMQALLAGSAEFSTSTDTPFVLAALQGLRPVVALNYSRYTHDMKITVRKDGPVQAMMPASLKGRKVATRVGTSGQYIPGNERDHSERHSGDRHVAQRHVGGPGARRHRCLRLDRAGRTDG